MSLNNKNILDLHRGGKISIQANNSVESEMDLAKVYTPGVAEVCKLLAQDSQKANTYSIKSNTIAVISDGSAVLGLGNIGPYGAIPVMEGKAQLFKQLGGVDAFPICLQEQSADQIVSICKALEPVFGGFNLEDIASPKCFEIESRLQQELSIPVMHDDQHATAIVTLAALYNALKINQKNLEDLKVVIAGCGAAGVATAKLLLRAGIVSRNMLVCDRKGTIFTERKENMNPIKVEIAQVTNTDQKMLTTKEAIVGADVFVGLSGPSVLDPEDIQKMAREPVVFALSNPEPEIRPEVINTPKAIIATGRSDYPNQINNVLAFPGIFRGLLDSGAKKVTTKIKLAVAKAIASLVSQEELQKGIIIPKALDTKVHLAVKEAVINSTTKISL